MNEVTQQIGMIIQFIQVNVFIQYFLMGALGSFFFDLTLYFNRDLGLLAQKKGIKPTMRFNVIFVVCNTAYSSSFGGLMAMWVDHALWLAFLVGFCNSVLFVFVVKTLLLNSTKKAFWVTIGKICASILLNPSKRFVVILEALTEKENDNKN